MSLERLKICHIATADFGGAGIAARRLNAALQYMPDLESHLLVANRQTDSMDIALAPSIRSIPGRVQSKFDHWVIQREHAPYRAALSRHEEVFTDDRVAGPMRLSLAAGTHDVVNLHWTAGFVDYRRYFASIARGTPVVWTLLDLNPFTGGCHYSLMKERANECDHFRKSCGMCPLLGSQNPNDVSAKIHARKLRALSTLEPSTTCIVAPSRWMKDLAAASSLLGRFDVRIIPLGVDTHVFRPHEKKAARSVLGIPVEKQVLLFAADYVTSYRKGLDLLMSALDETVLPSDLVVATVGGTVAPGTFSRQTFDIGRIRDERLMALAFSAADVFVAPSRAEAFGQVVTESMACGTPVIGFDIGGIRDIIRPGETGYLAKPGDHRSLGEAIARCLADRTRLVQMSEQSRRVAVAEYAKELQALTYRDLYYRLKSESMKLAASTAKAGH